MSQIVTSRSAPGWIYVMAHPAWDKIGMVKIGKTGSDPRTRAAEITSVAGLLAPCTIAWCSPVSDMAAAETAVHRMLGDKRVRKRRELFRVDSAYRPAGGRGCGGVAAITTVLLLPTGVGDLHTAADSFIPVSSADTSPSTQSSRPRRRWRFRR